MTGVGGDRIEGPTGVDGRPSQKTTIIITGVARGGTSLSASICHHLGIPMGRGMPRFENPYLQRAALAERWDVVQQLIDRTNQDLDLWGWKLPALNEHLERVSTMVNGPRFILVTKDVVSVARRRADPADGPGFARMVQRTAAAYARMAGFAKGTTWPVLFFSYEEADRDMISAIQTVAAFCGVDCPDPAAVREAIKADHDAYRSGVYLPRPKTRLRRKLAKIYHAAGLPDPEPREARPAEPPSGD